MTPFCSSFMRDNIISPVSLIYFVAFASSLANNSGLSSVFPPPFRGSSSRPRKGGGKTDDRPELFAREDANATKYMRETGEMILSLMKGVIALPDKIEGKPNNVTLAESWLPYGIPFVVIAGLVLEILSSWYPTYASDLCLTLANSSLYSMFRSCSMTSAWFPSSTNPVAYSFLWVSNISILLMHPWSSTSNAICISPMIARARLNMWTSWDSSCSRLRWRIFNPLVVHLRYDDLGSQLPLGQFTYFSAHRRLPTVRISSGTRHVPTIFVAGDISDRYVLGFTMKGSCQFPWGWAHLQCHRWLIFLLGGEPTKFAPANLPRSPDTTSILCCCNICSNLWSAFNCCPEPLALPLLFGDLDGYGALFARLSDLLGALGVR